MEARMKPKAHTTKRRKLQAEGGVTRISLDTGAVLQRKHGKPVWVRLRMDGPECLTDAGYADGTKHTFSGFGWGYGGTGPHGLVQWARDNGVPGLGDKLVFSTGGIEHGPHLSDTVVWEWMGGAEVGEKPAIEWVDATWTPG
jgi:hypothetical protein